MPVKIGRRPFTDCPVVWIMSNAGLTGLNDFSTGRGDVSNAQCSSLNVGEYPMTFKACGSDGNVLLWQGECVERQIIPPPPLSCFLGDTTKKYCDVSVSMSIPSFTFSAPAIVCRITGQIWPKGFEQSAILGCQNFKARGRWYLIYEIDGVQQLDAREGEVINLDATLSVSIPPVTAPFGECVGRGDCKRIPGLRLDTDGFRQEPQFGCSNFDAPLLTDGTCAKLSLINGCDKQYAYKNGSPFRRYFEVTGSVGDSIGPSYDNNALSLIYSQNDSSKFGFEYQATLFDDREGTGHYVIVNIVIVHNEAMVGEFSLQSGGYYSGIDQVAIVGETYVYKTTENLFDYNDDPAECARTITATLVSPGDVYIKPYLEGSSSNQFGVAPTTIELTATIIRDRQLEPEYVGPDAGDRLKATWSLEYDIQEQLWTLHSFEQIENPIYTLRDSNPCCGDSKILTRVQNIGAQGCDISPETITISRGGDFFGGEVQRRSNIRSGCPRTTKRAACDCQDSVIDYRNARIAKCVDITTPGCEDYGDDVKTRFPRNQLSCPSCERNSSCEPFLPEFVDVPCSYEALFGSGIGGQTPCDIIYENTDIASGVVTMRQKCRFTNPCEWVAVGPTGNVIDGVVGKNPASAICSATPLCSSNCTWEKIKVSADAGAGNVLQVYGISWRLNVVGNLTFLEYNHPSFGMLTYRVDEMEPFLCDNVNTLYLTSRGDLPDGVMPESICVRPRYSGCGGDFRYDVKSDAYAEAEDQIACCDPACGTMEGSMAVICCNQLDSCEAVATAQTVLLGIENPAGPSYLSSCTLHGVQWTAVLYCDGTRWLSDWYCGDPRQFIVTNRHTHTCCPLVLSYEPLPENFNGATCCPQADCTCNLRDEVTLTFSIVEPGAITASNCGPNPADCSDAGFDSPISIVLTREGIGAKYVGEACFLGGLPFSFQLTCGKDGINDTDAPVGDYQLLIFPPNAFSTCLNTPELRYSEMRQNQVSAPAILLEFDDYFCGDDHIDEDCRVFSNITITG